MPSELKAGITAHVPVSHVPPLVLVSILLLFCTTDRHWLLFLVPPGHYARLVDDGISHATN